MFLIRPSQQRAGSVLSCHLASSFEHRAAAFQLVYQSYLKSGLGANNAFKMRVTPFQLLNTSQIFVASELRPGSPEVENRLSLFTDSGQRGKPLSGFKAAVVSTITLVKDGLLGLPMEGMFGREVQVLRQAGRQVAEVTCLASFGTGPRNFLETFTQLTRLLAQFSRYEGVQHLLVSVHPRHVKFYARYFGFRPLSSRVADCPHVKGHPAIALDLNFDLYDIEQPQSWHKIFGTWEPKDKLRPATIPAGERPLWREVSTLGCPELVHLFARIDQHSEELQQPKPAPAVLPNTFSGFRRAA